MQGVELSWRWQLTRREAGGALQTRQQDSPSPVASRAQSVHRSLRTKKKSLELPDLASLTLTPASSQVHSPDPYYRRQKPSSPIPIPSAANGHASPGGGRQLPSTTDIPIQPSTHIPVYPPSRRSSANAVRQQQRQPSRHAPTPPTPIGERDEPFVEETVRSTIPLGVRPDVVVKKQAVSTTIYWYGGGKSVVLARAGDANWKGRQAMDKISDDSFSCTVYLLPGTHHIKFIVDDVWRVSDHLPTAVDDDGSLANYIEVSSSITFAPTTGTLAPSASAPLVHAQASFWSASSDAGASAPGEWTSVIPPALITAAQEEEVFLNDGAAGPAPHIPPAPMLPRHLDKLILNARPPAPRSEREGRERERTHRARERESRERGSRTRHSHALPELEGPDDDVRAPGSREGVTRLRGAVAGPTQALADDASVLPVPNHVVLHHLSTSAIRNGVLAVANTTRYRKKFITTVYYKPT
ncbi:5'-AMP-activated protein kinase beta subunit, interation domain-containing protein [Vararia minispora EC-137]|uniref:5'-AMP-activated protein kinase beta subunit, interation domain-containing protein n=1 Tax=Vararia minispora EC-137 TaxID=1314806 RepID=A0ACB8QL84_9AGAM|nr:5'-AMP-activated protein kinase beta subunit, interation domain-containing protein [Vararia minispora EC-137]